MTFRVNEYVWDRTWDSPAVVIGITKATDSEAACFRVAEINEQRMLGRVANRSADALCPYVRILLPADEAMAVNEALRRYEGGDVYERPRERIAKALMKRGVE